ncbi:DNA polymerase III subunit delta' [Inconstantimicrobium mannanitabidum]|uniref:DNA polymerase III subunit delta n=1 Tax=Inconstantimicrobium mannanitabidum TaxID=1604901 RepID=A0ACB5RI47_9CLOT|nr:DNA polymerase III subunit delta' [Clostridium sp. TW13]GKX68754.1 DNA polymerase III subunit delta' [Clostridium sp. TW13]
MNFVGHDNIRNGFKKCVINNTLSHAHLIIGANGIGKSLLAQEFALTILNKEQNREYVDIVKYRTDKNSFGVEEVRAITTEVYKRPFEGDKKVIIIYNGDKLTIQAQNALLKTIEEPPVGVFIIILCENGEQILDTVKSRCQIYKLTPLSINEINKYLDIHHNELREELRKTVIAFSEGVPGRIETFLKDESFGNIRNMVIRLFDDINRKNAAVVLKYEEEFSKLKDKEEEILANVVSLGRDVILYKELQDTSILINGDKIDDIRKLANEMSYKKLNEIVSIVGETKRNLRSNTNSTITFNVMFIKLLEV